MRATRKAKVLMAANGNEGEIEGSTEVVGGVRGGRSASIEC